ncbi:MAG: RHS repeat-associated core domain-containing protein, partial [Bacteroidia bacterium]|nr:RHS repeat-associated core domain-containing protein [Bacteroidia bacterium]
FNGTSPLKTIEWVYDATGTKLKKLVKSGGAIQYTQHYSSGIEYRQGATGAPVIEAIYHSEGRVFYTSATASRYEYSIRDHLGNTRITFSDLNANNKVDITTTASNEVLQENHYYPFGLSINGAWMNSAASLDNLYQYNGKELNNDWGLNMLDYGARMYMADLGRWSGVDELSEKGPEWNGYTYSFSNPIRFLDPDGRWAASSSRPTVEDKLEKYRKEKEAEWAALDAGASISDVWGAGKMLRGSSKGSRSRSNRLESVGDIAGESISGSPLDGVSIAGSCPCEYNGVIYNTEEDLYFGILGDKAMEQFGIKDIAEWTMILAGQPWIPTRGKFAGTTPGTSLASMYISKIPWTSPVPLPTVTGIPKFVGGKGVIVGSTKMVGRWVGRAIPIAGWGMLIYDAGALFYETQIEFDRVINRH